MLTNGNLVGASSSVSVVSFLQRNDGKLGCHLWPGSQVCLSQSAENLQEFKAHII